ncbi:MULTISPECIES: SDR family oxidoreductase [unclassified Hyphomicrobium]|uniref:SDR family NAD(P)-dependent oxidoreductase n=1 Tax=unclassified Hyphomicrobium TaxID=2619925 RepID=UPI000213DB1A|nr:MULTISPECIES: SDR family oxidoreductase [unclassified Hyphomicrobium]CCB66338.1 Short-chain dehydrogenase/reductase SDR [Hyphomicrobium sp. MC1]
MSASQGTAVVTGASSGIGAIYADRLAKRGYNLILVARNEERLKDVAARISGTTGRSVTILPADLNDKASLAKVESVLKENPAITMLVNNAGFGSAVPLLQSDIGKMVEMIDLNVTALTRLAYAAAPAFVSRGKGTIINISSVVGIAPELLNGVYGGSKAYVLAFSQSLQHELADKGVRIQAVLPGATATEFWDIAGFPHSNMPTSWVMSAEDMVDAALAGLDSGEVVTIPALQDAADWETYEAARKAMSGKLSNVNPAPRYGIKAAQPA